MATKDRAKWDEKYSQEGRAIPSPPRALIEHVDQLVAGSVLDVASGEGAASLYLSARPEFQVTAIDVSPIGLKNLSNFAMQQGLSIQTKAIDLDDHNLLDTLGQFDNICLFRFKPNIDLIAKLADMLSHQGRLMMSTFNKNHHLHSGFNINFCLEKEAFVNVSENLKLLCLHSSMEQPYTDTYVFEKVSN
jgi:2-polyprenyl-3-methyl-5-hydroxy-6-metoxy-1,4-benzoquinol methylase